MVWSLFFCNYGKLDDIIMLKHVILLAGSLIEISFRICVGLSECWMLSASLRLVFLWVFSSLRYYRRISSISSLLFSSLCMPSLPVIPVVLRPLVLVFRKWLSWKFTIILSDRHYFPLHLKICQSTCMRWQFVQICSGAYTNSSCRKTRQCTSAPSGSAHIWVFRSKQGLCRVLLTCKHHCRFCT